MPGFTTSPLKQETVCQDASNIVEKEIASVPLESDKSLLINNQSMASFLSMGSAEVEVGFLQV